jgi:ABC-type multidrug transport system fused ATPase/permease subunit
MLRELLSMEYTTIRKVNRAEYIRKLTVDNYELVIRVLIPGSILIVEFATTFMLISLLVIYNPRVMMIFLLIGLVIAYLYKIIISNKIKNWAEKKHSYENNRIQIVQEVFGGIKEIKIAGESKKMMGIFNEVNRESCVVSAKLHYLQQLPRIWLDTMGLWAIACIVLWAHYNRQMDIILPFMVLSAAVGARILPSLNRIVNSLNELKYSDSLIKELPKIQNKKIKEIIQNQKINFEFKSLELMNIAINYENKYLIRNCSLRLLRGEALGIVGPSGCGKSSMLDIMLGLIHPYEGRVLINGFDIQNILNSYRKIIGYVPQETFIFNKSLAENIAYGTESSINYNKVNSLLKQLSLTHLQNSIDEYTNNNFDISKFTISGGEKQRIGLARALYRDPQILILDEATSSLDLNSQNVIIDILKKIKGKVTIILVTHRLELLSIADIIHEFEIIEK